MSNFSNKLGSFGPWIISEGEKLRSSRELPHLLGSSHKYEVEESSILSLLNIGHFLGDRTLIKGVTRQPWMAKSYLGNGDYEFHDVPEHKNLKVPSQAAARRLYDLLEKEIIDSIGSSKCIGILLTGGMDSRMIAGILHSLIERQQLSELQIVGVTWGRENSRDVEYAKKIAQRLGWDWTHLETESADLIENIDICVEEGCEFSPVHLHAMPKVAKLKGIDCILAGSYGDSIGRGEYSGQTVRELKSLNSTLRNRMNFLKGDVYQNALKGCEEDFKSYWKRFPRAEGYKRHELDYQLHYMRRMLNPCMAIVNRNIPLYQMFTSPEVFGYMWSLDSDCRNNYVYRDMMEMFETSLSDIPWARTGTIYMGEETELPDSLYKRHHTYSDMINGELYDDIRNLVVSDELESLNIFNMKSLENMMALNRRVNYKESTFIEEKLIWLAALAKAVRKYGLTTNYSPSREKVGSVLRSGAETLLFNSYHIMKNR